MPAKIVNAALTLAAVIGAAVLFGSACNLANKPPTVPIVFGPSLGFVGDTVTFKATATDPEGDSVAFEVNWGDSSSIHLTGFVGSGETASAAHVYPNVGIFSISARARDRDGKVSAPSAACTLTVKSSSYPDSVLATIAVGGDPTDIAVLPDGRFAYVANQGAQYVTVVNLETRTVVAQVTCGTNPYMVAARPDGQFVYATSEIDDNVSVIRTGDNAVVATVPVGDNPHRLCFSPDGSHCYTADENDNTVTVIRTSDNTVVAAVPVGSMPRDVDCTTDGQYAYAANTGDSTVTKIRTSDNTVVKTIRLDFRAHRVRAMPGGEYVYVSDYDGDRIAAVRVGDNRVVTTIHTGAWVRVSGMCFMNGGDYLYVATNYGGGAATVIRTADNTVVAHIPVGRSPLSLRTPADEGFVASADRSGRSVTVIGRKTVTLP